MNRWPAITLLGITCAVFIGLVHASLNAATDCLFGADELGARYTDWADGFGPDGYS